MEGEFFFKFCLLFFHWRWYLSLSKLGQRQWMSHWPDTPCGACPFRASQRQNRQQRKTKSSLNNAGPKIAMGFMTTAAGKAVDHLPESFRFVCHFWVTQKTWSPCQTPGSEPQMRDPNYSACCKEAFSERSNEPSSPLVLSSLEEISPEDLLDVSSLLIFMCSVPYPSQ